MSRWLVYSYRAPSQNKDGHGGETGVATEKTQSVAKVKDVASSQSRPRGRSRRRRLERVYTRVTRVVRKSRPTGRHRTTSGSWRHGWNDGSSLISVSWTLQKSQHDGLQFLRHRLRVVLMALA